MKKILRPLWLSAVVLLLASCNDFVFVSSITLSSCDVFLKVGETEQLTYEVVGAKSKNPEICWYSNNDSIATVSQNGLITAIGVGETEVIAQVTDGTGGKSVCLVKVE